MPSLLRRLLMVSGLAAIGCSAVGAPAAEVTVTAYYGAHAKPTQERAVPFNSGDTVMSVTLRAVRVETNAQRTFVKSIEGVAHDEASKDYWLYFVNGQAMHVGAAETKIKPGDRVLWFLRRQGNTTHTK